MAITFTLNGKSQSVDVSADMPLLWVLRDTLNMTGTKFGCGMALCGACTVHINGEATRSCITPVSSVAGKKITTIEGLSADGSHPVQRSEEHTSELQSPCNLVCRLLLENKKVPPSDMALISLCACTGSIVSTHAFCPLSIGCLSSIADNRSHYLH